MPLFKCSLWEKKVVLQLALQFNLHIVNVNEQVAWIAKLQLIAIQLQLYQNN
jgi:hypothetical protein